jgi:hypothetical protein
MSGDSTQGVGAGVSATADVVSAANAAAIKMVLVENSVIMRAPRRRSEKVDLACRVFLNKSRTTSIRWPPPRHQLRRLRLCDFPRSALRLSCDFGLEAVQMEYAIGMIRMNQVARICCAVASLFVMPVVVAQADEFKLSNNQRISCSRGLSAGKLNTATCKSYAYLFNVKTSEYFRCQVSLALTRDNKEVINVQTDGGCTRKPRIFDTDSSYSFDATETEPPNTNSFFGPGGYAIWASDNTAQKVRGCITISSGLGSDISKCLDMTFQ